MGIAPFATMMKITNLASGPHHEIETVPITLILLAILTALTVWTTLTPLTVYFIAVWSDRNCKVPLILFTPG